VVDVSLCLRPIVVVQEVYRLQVDLRNRVDAELRAVEQLYQNTVLTLGDLNKWLSLRHQVLLSWDHRFVVAIIF
jgi:hypothetical protein